MPTADGGVMTRHLRQLLRGDRSNRGHSSAADDPLSTFLQSTNFACLTDAKGLVRRVAPRVETLLGMPCDAWTGTSIFDGISPRDHARADDLWAETTTAPGRLFMADLRFRHSDGSWRWLGVDAMSLLDDPTVQSVVLGLRDIHARKVFEDQVAFRQHHDGLTSLPNRLLFLERMDQALSWSRRQGSLIGALFMDIDRFAHVNEEYGWHVGDALLIRFAERLRTCIRKGDTAAHLSEDEFVVLLEDLEHPDDVVTVALRIFDACRDPFVINGARVRIGLSIGIATTDDGARDSRTLVGQAGAAMCSAKDAGRGQYDLYQPNRELEPSVSDLPAPQEAGTSPAPQPIH